MDATHSPDRAAWRLAVAEVAAKAHEKLPACNGRIDSAVKIVLAGDVELLPAGGARVASRSDASVHYHTVNGHCDCRDFPRAPDGLCAHRLAYGIARRAAELVPPASAGEPVCDTAQPVCYSEEQSQTCALPEAPVSITLKATLHGHEVLVTLRGTDFASVQAQVEQASQWLRSQAPVQASSGAGWCQKHNCAMKETTKDGKSWWSHRHEGQWCKGKVF